MEARGVQRMLRLISRAALKMPKRPPTYLDKIARRKWRELLPMLSNHEPAMLDALEQYSVAWSRWLAATDDAAKIRWSRCCRQWGAVLRKSRSNRKTTPMDDPVLRLLGG